jgi:hypothetical protein
MSNINWKNELESVHCVFQTFLVGDTLLGPQNFHDTPKNFFDQIQRKIIQNVSFMTFFRAVLTKLVDFGLIGKISRDT